MTLIYKYKSYILEFKFVCVIIILLRKEAYLFNIIFAAQTTAEMESYSTYKYNKYINNNKSIL